MEIHENDILRYLEPVYRFCAARVGNPADAEDLASEIMLHVLSGLRKYPIDSLDAWVWRIARNRYARWAAGQRVLRETRDESQTEPADDYDLVDEIILTQTHQALFRCLHTLSREYRNITVDYYVHELSVGELAARYALTPATVKWRLNVSREKLKTRMGESEMEKIYQRIHWNTRTCNGAASPHQYLHSQIARAICEAAYDAPLTVEDLSLKTGLPTLYIEDELPRLLAGEAVTRTGKRYATNFIVLRLADRERMEKSFAPYIAEIADAFARLFDEKAAAVKALPFYGADFGMARLGYIALPAVLRARIRDIQNARADWADGPYPPRLDGGYGWFLVEEKEDETEASRPFSSGCNSTDEADGVLYYYWVGKYFAGGIYHGTGTRFLSQRGLVPQCTNGILPPDAINEAECLQLRKNNLIARAGADFKLNFPCFTAAEYADFLALFHAPDAQMETRLTALLAEIHRSFRAFAPKRLAPQINQWVSCYTHSIIGFAAQELIVRGVLETPKENTPLTGGVFFVAGKELAI